MHGYDIIYLSLGGNMEKNIFVKCDICGNVAIKAVDGGAPLFCCGKVMNPLAPNTTDAAVEKHLPVIEINDSVATIKVGSVMHPMTNEHYISTITVKTNKAEHVFYLTPDLAPEIKLALADNENILSAIAFCNLHGAWETKRI